MLIRTHVDGGCMVSIESVIIKAELFLTDGEINAYLQIRDEKIRLGVYPSISIARYVMDEIYVAAKNGEAAYTMPGYDYKMED